MPVGISPADGRVASADDSLTMITCGGLGQEVRDKPILEDHDQIVGGDTLGCAEGCQVLVTVRTAVKGGLTCL